MLREEAIQMCMEVRHYLTQGNPIWDKDKVGEALDMAIEALKAQDRPIICPRCGRTFAESEGRE